MHFGYGLMNSEDRIIISDSVLQALRSDHAVEDGVVEIYRIIMAVSRDASVREFASLHLVTEHKHLELMEGVIPEGHRSRFLPLCRWGGWITGALLVRTKEWRKLSLNDSDRAF